MSTEKIESLVVELSKDPFNPHINFACAVEYELLNQTASAVSFYLRAAEYGFASNPVIAYTSLLKMAHCFEDQNDRTSTVSNCLQQAVTVLPKRPEAYFLLSQFHERQRSWQESYTYAEIGLSVAYGHEPLPINVGYTNHFFLEYQKAVSAWWIGRRHESIILFNKLKEKTAELPEEYLKSIESNLKVIGG